MRRVSPEEIEFAFVDAWARDIQDEDLREQWYQFSLQTSYCYIVMDGEDDLTWKAKNLRSELGQNYATMRRTTMQQVYDVLQYKIRHEKRSGPISAQELANLYLSRVKSALGSEEISKSFVDIACTVQTRILADDCMRQVMLTLDDMAETTAGKRKNPFDGIQKLQALIEKACLSNCGGCVLGCRRLFGLAAVE